MSAAFRETRRQYGVRVPIGDVPTHLAGGWRLPEDLADEDWSDGCLLLRPPRFLAGEERPCGA